EDSNANNAFNAGELGIAGVTLTLSGTNGLGQTVSGITTTTAADGTYSFSGLRPGTYVVTETVPATYLAGAATVGTVNGTAVGTATSSTAIGSIALTSGQGGVNYRFGDYRSPTRRSSDHEDSNANNAKNAGELGLANVTLTLSGTNGLGQAVSGITTTTAA